MTRHRLACVVMFLLAPLAHADEKVSWLGKMVMARHAGFRIDQFDGDGKKTGSVFVSSMVVHVVGEDGDRIRLRDNGAEWWTPRAQAILVDDAIPFFTDRIQANADDASAYAHRAVAHYVKRDLVLALKDHDEAIRLAPRVAVYLNNRGICLTAKKDYDRALTDLDEAIGIDATDSTFFTNRGQIRRLKKDYAKAIEDHNEAIRLSPKQAQAYVERGNVYADLKDFDKAIKDYSEAIRIDSKHLGAHNQRGLVFLDRNQLDRAEADFDEAIRLEPKSSAVHNNRGLLYGQKGDHAKAIQEYTEAIRLEPKKEGSYINRAQAYSKIKNYEAEAMDYGEVLKINPKRGLALNNLAWLLASCPKDAIRDGKKAVEYGTKACELSKWKDANDIGTLAGAYAEAGDFKAAVMWEKKALAVGYKTKAETTWAEMRLKLYEAGKPYREE